MKIRNTLIALLAIAGSAFVTPAKAAVTFTAGDLILGFRSTSSSSVYLVNVGAATNYRDATADITNIVNINSDLTTAFGAGWTTQADLFWEVAGVRANLTSAGVVNGDPGQTVYVSRAEPTVGTQTTAWGVTGQTVSATNLTAAAGKMVTVQGEFAAATPTSLANATIMPSSGAGSTSWDDTGYSNTWGAFTSTNGGTPEGNFAAGTAGTALDLFRVLGTTTGANPTGTLRVGSYEGTFHIDDSGNVGFSVAPNYAAAPEPSRALLLGFGAMGFIFRRRRNTKKA
ncbi:MAG: PEP-CTERM sorting domain-containing protein [Verrucomicrobiaceae bacterium]|nr:PEP-CTERM sorting domain-containing protein [Verrucomicrobiaceae bacterium]